MFGFLSHPPGEILFWSHGVSSTRWRQSSGAWLWSLPFFVRFPSTHPRWVCRPLTAHWGGLLPNDQGTAKAALKCMGAMREPQEAASQPDTRMRSVLPLSRTFTRTRVGRRNSAMWILWRYHVWSKTEISNCIISLSKKSSGTSLLSLGICRDHSFLPWDRSRRWSW